MLHQPRVPPTGQRQAVEIAIKWKEVLAQKNAFLEILSRTTGHSTAKLDKVSARSSDHLPKADIQHMPFTVSHSAASWWPVTFG